jgi:hypothetical protein
MPGLAWRDGKVTANVREGVLPDSFFMRNAPGFTNRASVLGFQV